MRKTKKRKKQKRKRTKKEYKKIIRLKKYRKTLYLKKMLNLLEQKIDFLSHKFNIKGYSKEDLKQELRLKVLEDINKNIGYKKQEGWWFKRLQWHLHNLLKKEERNPLNQAKSLSGYRI